MYMLSSHVDDILSGPPSRSSGTCAFPGGGLLSSFKYCFQRPLITSDDLSHLQNNLFAQTLRYAQNFILGISIICLW